MSESDSDYGMLNEMPGYSAVLKAVLRNQIRHLVEQLASNTDEESVVLTASITDDVCTVVNIGSELGKSFLKDHDHIRSQLEKYLLKAHLVKMNLVKERDKKTTGRPVSSLKSSFANSTKSFTRSKPYPTKKPSKDNNVKLNIKTETNDIETHMTDSPTAVHADTPGVALSSRTATDNSTEKMNHGTNIAGSRANAEENCSSTVSQISAASLESDDSNHTYEEMACSVETHGHDSNHTYEEMACSVETFGHDSNHTYEEMECSVETHESKKDVIGHLNISKASVTGLEENVVDKIFSDTAMDMDRNLFADSAKILHDIATDLDRNLYADSEKEVADFKSELIDGDSNNKENVGKDLNDMDLVDAVGSSKDSERVQNFLISDCTKNDRKNSSTKKQLVISDKCCKSYGCNLCMRKFDFHCHLKRHICTEKRDSNQSLCTSDHSITPVVENPEHSSNNSALQTSTDVFGDEVQETVTGNYCVGAKTSGLGDESEEETCEEWEMFNKFIDNIVFKNDGQQYITCKKCYKEFLGKRFAAHVLTHTKPYRCTKCGQGFRGRIDRTYHQKKKHNIEEDDEFETKEDFEAQRVRDIFQSVISRRSLSKLRSEKTAEKPKTIKINLENDRGIFSDLPPDSPDNNPEQIDITLGQRTTDKTDIYETKNEYEKESTCLKGTGKHLGTEEVYFISDKSSQNPCGEGPENYISRIKYKDGIQYVSCKQCGKEFRGKRFSEHIFTHLKPFKCKDCGAGFRYKSDRNMHMAVQHHYPSATSYSDKEDFKSNEISRELKAFLSKYVQSGTDGNQTDTVVHTLPTIETTNTITDTNLPDRLEITSHDTAESPTNVADVELMDTTNNINNVIDDTFIIEEVGEISKKRKTFLTCEICGIALTNGRYKEHMRIHNKPFKCKQCDYTAARRRTLEMHLFKKHGLTADDLFEEL